MGSTATRHRRSASGSHEYKVPAVHRAFEILSLLSQSDRDLGVSEIASLAKIGKGPCFAILKTLERSEAVLFNAEQKTYRLGAGLVRLGDATLGKNASVEAARPEIERLAKKIGFACFLSAPYGSADFIIVAKSEISKNVKVTLDIGQYFPVLGGAQGGAFLAWQPPQRVDEAIARLGLPKHTAKSITNVELFKQRLKRTRRLGYAVSCGEYMIGVNSVAAPIFDRSGEVVLILKTLGTSEALNERKMAELGRLVRKTAETITLKIGGHYPDDAKGSSGS
jgi:DNA-binding IclR family transcriptional regulator